LDSLEFQTEKRFEVIVSEDAEHDSMKAFLDAYRGSLEIYHLTQPDQGWQKNKMLNKSALFAHSDHLIFIDGDCVLHPRFIEFHTKLAAPKAILAGKRIKLDLKTTHWLLEDKNRISQLQKYIRQNYFKMKRRGAQFGEEGLFIDPSSWLGWIPKMRTMYQIKGCNMSFSKKALFDINGFDEDYTRPAIGEDIDLGWRFRGLGYRIKSLRNLAVQYHLFHKESWVDQKENELIMKRKQQSKQYVCQNGIS
jgi:cellulose synthase/poly-beta-1,6-N-acetylglucosamine synthase-like glycosyltransferase